jgi:hypothetical protein
VILGLSPWGTLKGVEAILPSQRLFWIEVFGWVASLMIIIAYALTTMEAISPADPLTHCLNFVGAVGVGLVTYVKRAYQSVLLNVIWAIVAIIGFLRYLIA